MGGVIFSASFYILLYFTDVKGMWRTMAAYNIFMVAGYLFFRRLSFKYLSIYAVLLALLVGFLMIYGYTFTPMQDNKIELNPLFVAYGLFALCVLGILLHKINIPACKVFEVFNKRGYTIYLYQNIAFCFIYPLHLVLVSKLSSNLLQFLICSVIVFVISYAMSFITYRFEFGIMKLLRLK